MLRKVLIAALLTGTASVSFAGDNWNGFYAGVSLGAGSYSADFNDRDDWYDNQGLNGDTDVATNFGVQAGVNFQADSFVYGVELGYSRFNAKSQGLPWDDAALTAELDSTISLKGRVGMASGNNLFYVAAGPTWAKTTFTATDSGPVASGDSKTLGISIAAGIERKFNSNWSGRLQVEQTSFETSDLAVSTGNDRFSHDDQLMNVTLGVSYNF